MDILSAIIYGIIQGLTEFLPVSSSGHLALLPHFLEIRDPGVAFDLSMHVGTALSVAVYFKKEVKALLTETIYLYDLKRQNGQRAFLINMIFSTFTTVILAFFVKDVAEAYGRSSRMIEINLIVFGVIMWLVDHFQKKSQDDLMMKTVQKTNATIIGFFQVIALFPGVSRSGITLTISRMLGLSRKESTRYSFLLSLPLIIGGFVLKLPEVLRAPEVDMMEVIVGAGISFIVGLLAIHFFLKVVENLGLGIWALYRIILGGLLLIFF